MSRINGDRSRFNRVRKARMHQRTRMRALRNVKPAEVPAEKKTESTTP